jgi:hypothetical protein
LLRSWTSFSFNTMVMRESHFSCRKIDKIID